MLKSPKLRPPISLRLTPKLEAEIERLATENGLAVTSQIRMVLTRGLSFANKAKTDKRVKKH